MKNRAAKAGLIFLEVMAIVVAVFAAGAVFLFWRVEQGPVSLSFFKPSIQFAVDRRLPDGFSCDVKTITLSRKEDRSAYMATLSDLRIFDDQGKPAASAPELELAFGLKSLLSGEVGPKSVVANGAKFRVVRDEAQKVEIPAVRSGRRKSSASFISDLLGGGVFHSAFEQALLTDAEVEFIDVASGRSWLAKGAHVDLEKSALGFSASAGGDIDMGGEAASVSMQANYTAESGVVTADIDGAKFPVGDLLSMFYGDGAAVIDATVSGKAVIAMTKEGRVLSSRFSARLEEGQLRIGKDPIPVHFIEWETAFDPQKNQFMIDRFAFDAGGVESVLTGAVDLEFGEDARDPKRIGFDLKSDAAALDLPGWLEAPLSVENIALVGGYHIHDRRLSFQQLTLSTVDITARGDFAMSMPRANEEGFKASPAIDANIDIEGDLDPQRLLRIWPLGVAMGARDWIEDRMYGAVIENIEAKLALAEGAIDEVGFTPDEAVHVTFDVRDAKAYFVKRMTPVTQGRGRGVLRGNSFKLTVDGAQVGKVAIREGEVEYPEFMPKWRPTYMRFLAIGNSKDILGVMDQAPLSLLSKINLSPDQFDGAARARIEIMRPNKRDVPPEDYRYSGKASFDNMRIAGLTGDAEFTDGKGTVDLKPRSVTIVADALMSEAPINIVWRQNFYQEDGPSQFSIAGTVDSTTGDLFGVPSRQYIRGPVAIKADAFGTIGDFNRISAELDFTDAVMSFDALGWRKAAGASALGAVDVEFAPDAVTVEKVEIIGEGIAVSGGFQLQDNLLTAAAFPQFDLDGAASLRLSAERKATGELALSALGDFLNMGPTLEGLIASGTRSNANGGNVWGSGVDVTARIDRMRMRENVEYANVSLDLWRDVEKLQALDFSAFSSSGAPLKAVMSHTGDDEGPGQSIEATTSDLGALLDGVFAYKAITGGEGSMQIGFGGEGHAGLGGTIEARNLRVVDAPLLARLFSAGSFEGLADLMNGEGIDLSYVYGEFDYFDNLIALDNFRATGPSVGVTANGDIAVSDGGMVNLSGAVAPIYQLNSVLGNTPIIGELLVGKKGEGVVALSYGVSGLRSSPDVYINPLSALTPGILRNLFEPMRIRPEPPAELAPEPVETEASETETPQQ